MELIAKKQNIWRQSSILAFLSALLTGLCYIKFAHLFIDSIYQAAAHPLLNKLITGQSYNTLNTYFNKADALFFRLFFQLIGLSLISYISSFGKKTGTRYALFISLLAIFACLNSQFSSYINPYVINDDVRQHIWWMASFQDPHLFQNDLLTRYAASLQNGGILIIFYCTSFIVDPIVMSKILPLILFTYSAGYLFRLIKHLTNDNFTAAFTTICFLITPVFLHNTVGGHAHTFGFCFLLMFLYYFVTRAFTKASSILILQALTFPIVFVLSTLTFFVSFFFQKRQHPDGRVKSGKMISFIVCFSIALGILTTKFVFFSNPEIGHPVSMAQMKGNPEFYNGARWPLLPVPFVLTEAAKNAKTGIFLFDAARKNHWPKLLRALIDRVKIIHLILIFSALFIVIKNKKLFFPVEFIYLAAASLFMYILAQIFLLKLYAPDRYTAYSLPLITLILFGLIVGKGVGAIKKKHLKTSLIAFIFIFCFAGINLNRDIGLADFTKNKPVFIMASRLPKDALIAAHPYLADGIPTFAKRKVFLKWELSVPLFDKYWNTVKTRTFDFFNAYYSDDPQVIVAFAQKYNIDYILVDETHFDKNYLEKGQFYFEPFNTAIGGKIKKTKKFALNNIDQKAKLYSYKNLFIINPDTLKNKKDDEKF